jgi:hypothetical protein
MTTRPTTMTRRGFVQLLGAGLAACSSRPARDILPYAQQPPEVTPGVPLYFATALVEDGFTRVARRRSPAIPITPRASARRARSNRLPCSASTIRSGSRA